MTPTPEEFAALSIDRLISLKGRNAVVTGGARGLGYAISRRLAEAGANVLTGDLNSAGAAEAAQKIAADFGVKAIAAELDVTDSGSVARFAEKADSEFGRLDIWVNNAGIYPPAILADTTDEQWDLVQDVNLRGTFLGCRAAAQRMRESRQGVIINITSVSGHRGRPSIAHYAAAKHGVVGLTKGLAMELGPLGVRVLAVAPAMTETPGLDEQRAKYAGNTEAARTFRDMEERILQNFPLRRFGHPDDIARVVLFAASDLAAYVTATTVFCDGGISVY